MEDSILQQNFERKIWEVTNIMKLKYGYNPTIFIKMIEEHGMLESVKRLINNMQPSYGFTKLWELKRLDLSLEAICLDDEWKELFTEEEQKKAKEKLKKYEYEI